jgi:hypothetical protein
MVKEMTLELTRKFTSAEYFLSNFKGDTDFFYYGMSWSEFREKCHYILENFGISSPWRIIEIGGAAMTYCIPNEERLYKLFTEWGYKDEYLKKYLEDKGV